MFFDFDNYTYYIRPGVTDMRKGIISLAQMVRDTMDLNPFQKSMFIFCGRTRKLAVVLVWDNGFWLMKKRINKGTFAWPATEEQALQVSVRDLQRFLEGEDVFRRIPFIGRDFEI